MEELPGVLLANQATVKTPMGEIPFTLTSESEMVVSVEVGMPIFRVKHFNQGSNDKKLKEQLDLLAEKRKEVEIRMAINKRKVEHYFNRRVKPRSFKVGNLILKETKTTTQEEGKIGP